MKLSQTTTQSLRSHKKGSSKLAQLLHEVVAESLGFKTEDVHFIDKRKMCRATIKVVLHKVLHLSLYNDQESQKSFQEKLWANLAKRLPVEVLSEISGGVVTRNEIKMGRFFYLHSQPGIRFYLLTKTTSELSKMLG